MQRRVKAAVQHSSSGLGSAFTLHFTCRQKPSGEKGRPSFREVKLHTGTDPVCKKQAKKRKRIMEKMMVLKGVSPVMSRQFPDKQTGATVTIHWVELTMTDGIDTIVGELTLPKVRNAQGEYDDPKAPGFDTDRIYAVAFEIDGASGTTADGKYWSRNRVNIRKIVAP